jgi:hypothetical protein
VSSRTDGAALPARLAAASPIITRMTEDPIQPTAAERQRVDLLIEEVLGGTDAAAAIEHAPARLLYVIFLMLGDEPVPGRREAMAQLIRAFVGQRPELVVIDPEVIATMLDEGDGKPTA